MLELFTKLCLTFLLAALLIKSLKPFAKKVGLLDKPGGRKQHLTATPMIGGIALYGTILISSVIWGKAGVEMICYLLSAGIMVVTGALDDRFDLRVRWRILLETIAALIMIYGAGIVVVNLGDLIGTGDIIMSMWLAVPFTVIATFGVINCLNMIDGVDGLAAGLSLISVFGFVATIGGTGSSLVPIIALIAGLMAFLVFNLQLYPGLKKVFLGDAGSMLLGFTLVWIMVRSTQSVSARNLYFEPVTALYLLGLPLFDMVSTVVRRAAKKQNPFRPDRTHIHHLLMHSGLTGRETLFVLLGAQLLINGVGVLFHHQSVLVAGQFAVFIICFFAYYWMTKHAFKTSRVIRKIHGKSGRIVKKELSVSSNKEKKRKEKKITSVEP